jgi:hypothetical protein
MADVKNGDGKPVRIALFFGVENEGIVWADAKETEDAYYVVSESNPIGQYFSKKQDGLAPTMKDAERLCTEVIHARWRGAQARIKELEQQSVDLAETLRLCVADPTYFHHDKVKARRRQAAFERLLDRIDRTQRRRLAEGTPAALDAHADLQAKRETLTVDNFTAALSKEERAELDRKMGLPWYASPDQTDHGSPTKDKP